MVFEPRECLSCHSFISQEHLSKSNTQILRSNTGTHYSSSTIVLHYMVRLQPYAMLHTKLQSGHFDKSDRLFKSIGKSWRSASGIDTTKNTQDVKELIPEFFYMPEMFKNVNEFDMGALQNGNVTHFNTLFVVRSTQNTNAQTQVRS